MSKISKIIDHPDRKSIERDIIEGKSNSQIARDYSKGRYEISREAVRRYREDMISKQLIHEDLSTLEGLRFRIDDYYSELDDFITAIVDELRDKDGKISYSPRASEIDIIYTHKTEDGNTVKDSATLQELLDRASGEGDILIVTINTPDPRKMLLQATTKINKYFSLILKAYYSKSQLKDAKENKKIRYVYPPAFYDMVNVVNESLLDYPEAKEKLAEALIAKPEEYGEDEEEAYYTA